MALHRAGEQVELCDDAELALAIGHQLAIALHRGKSSIERFALGRAANRQRARELIGVHRHALLTQSIEDLLTTWDVNVAARSASAAQR